MHKGKVCTGYAAAERRALVKGASIRLVLTYRGNLESF